MPLIEISRILVTGSFKPFVATCSTHSIKGKDYRFNTLDELCNFYQISNPKKTGRKDWAMSENGKEYTFPIYEAEIGEEYINQSRHQI